MTLTWRQLQEKITNLSDEQLDMPIVVFIDHIPFSLPVTDLVPKSAPAASCLVSDSGEWSSIAQDSLSLRTLCYDAAVSLEKYGINTDLSGRIRDTLTRLRMEEWANDPTVYPRQTEEISDVSSEG